MRATTLQLVIESKLEDLLPGSDADERWEASGVLVQDGVCYVAFDNRTDVAKIAVDLRPNPANGLCGASLAKQGFEGIAFNPRNRRFYLLIECRKDKRGGYRPDIVEYNDEFEYVKRRPMDFEFASSNRGFEAIAYKQRDGQDYLLALCEGNKCKCGGAGRTPGGGRIQLFGKRKKEWSHIEVIKLPRAVEFVDYSGMAVGEHGVAVVSQETSMLWVGVFDAASWDWRDEGRLFAFSADGRR